MAKTKRNTSISRKKATSVKKSKTWDLDSVFELKPSVFFRAHSQDKIVVMNVENEEDYFEITGTAGRVFQAIDGKRSVNAIIRKIEAKEKSESLKSNVQKLFTNLLQENLIQLAK